MIKLSVIVPVYNVEKYLPRCLDSLINQTLNEIEIICVNDGSTDKSLKVLERYAKNDSRIIIVNQKNKGMGFARNVGIDRARGKYIAFVDPDDWVEIDAYEQLYNECEKKNAQVLLFDYNIVSNKNKLNYSEAELFKEKFGYDLVATPYFTKEDIKNFLFDVPVGVNKIYLREFFNKYNIKFPEGYILEDSLFSFIVYYYAEKIHYINKSFYNYYQRSNSSVHVYFDPNLTLFDIINQHKEFIVTHFPAMNEKVDELTDTALIHAYITSPRFAFKFKKRFRKKYLEVFGKEKYKKFLEDINTYKVPFYYHIFSIRNRFYRFKKKEITILGFRFLFEKKMQN